MNTITKKLHNVILTLKTKREDLTIYKTKPRPKPQTESYLGGEADIISDIYLSKINPDFYKPVPKPNFWQSLPLLFQELTWRVKYIIYDQKLIMKSPLNAMKLMDAAEPLTPIQLNLKYKKPIYTKDIEEGTLEENKVIVEVINKTETTPVNKLDEEIFKNREEIIHNFNEKWKK